MPDFRYRSINGEGKTVTGITAASDENSLTTLLQNQGLILVEAEVATAKTLAKEAGPTKAASTVQTRAVKRQELIRFTYNLHAIVSAGVPIVKGLESLLQEAVASESPMEPVLNGLIQRLQSGDSFSEALAMYPRVFPELYVNLVAAGESSGNLETILIDLGANLEWQEEIKSTLKQATVYPTIVISAVIGLIVLILMFVLPQFTEIFTKMNIPLPTATKVLMAVGEISQKYWHIALVGTVGSVIGLVVMSKTKKGKYMLEKAKVNIPLFGSVVMKIAVSRFTKNLSVLNNAGVSITEALIISEKIAGNPSLAEAIRQARELVMKGEPLAKAMECSPVFPVLVRNMVAVGEESGKLGSSLERVSQFYDREVKMGLKRAFAILEPAITIFLAVVVGGIAVTIISTLYKAITLIGK